MVIGREQDFKILNKGYINSKENQFPKHVDWGTNNSQMKFLTYSCINLKNKMAGYFTSKKYLFRNNRELQFATGKLWQNYRQVQ